MTVGKLVAPSTVVSVVRVGPVGGVGSEAGRAPLLSIVGAVGLLTETAACRPRRHPVRPPTRRDRGRRVEVGVILPMHLSVSVGRDRATMRLRRGVTDGRRHGKGLRLAGACISGRTAWVVSKFDAALRVCRLTMRLSCIEPDLENEDGHDELRAEDDEGDSEGGVGARVDSRQLGCHLAFRRCRRRDAGCWVKTHICDDE